MRKKKAIYNMLSSIALQIILVLSNFIIPRLTILIYGSSINGLINSITQFLSYITLLESGIGAVIQVKYYKAFAKNDHILLNQIYKESNIFFRIIGYITIGYTGILCLIYPYIIKTEFSKETVLPLILILSATVLTQYFFGITNQCIIQADQKMYVVNTAKICANILNIIVFIILIYFKSNIFYLKSVSVIILSIIPLSLLIYTKKNYKIDKNVPRNKAVLSDKFSGIGQHIATYLHSGTDIFLLTFFSNSLEISVYSVYAFVLTALRSIEAALNNAVSAAFGNMIQSNEKEKMIKNYIAFDHLNNIVVFSIFTIAFLLVLPFVRLYTSGATDVNYIRPIYAAIALFSEAVYCILCSYTCIIFAAGHFKQTVRNCYIEAFLNIIISLILVKKYGLIGVGIGTAISTFYRCIDYIFYLSKNIICWEKKKVFLRLIVNCIGFVCVYFSTKWIDFNSINSVKSWIFYAIITSILSFSIYIIINTIFFKKEVIEIKNIYVAPILRKLTRYNKTS